MIFTPRSLFVVITSCCFLVSACNEDIVTSAPSIEPVPENIGYPINDTGIILCGNYDTNYSGTGDSVNNLDCYNVAATQTNTGTDSNGHPVPAGQDAVYGRDFKAGEGVLTKVGTGHAGFDFTKLDSNGDELTVSAIQWHCVRDNHTGLVWEVKADDGNLRDKGWTYSWYNSDAASNGGNAGIADNGDCFVSGRCDIEKYVADINAESLCGYDDWRLPLVSELANIVHNDRGSPSIDNDFFPHTSAVDFWSASAKADSSSLAYIVEMDGGEVRHASKTIAKNLRVVRGPKPASSSNNVLCDNENNAVAATTPADDFIVHGDGTVTHATTGLTWMQCSLGQVWDGNNCSGEVSTFSWLPAHEKAQDTTFAEYSDWRLPNRNELSSIIERRCYDPYINTKIFPDTPSLLYWTASPFYKMRTYAWRVNFLTGFETGANKGFSSPVRLVRSD